MKAGEGRLFRGERTERILGSFLFKPNDGSVEKAMANSNYLMHILL
jgi:hypothetical protein